ncbi:MAG: sigma-70 family RNA polymerase sigma factor, partial [Elusimicrobia bacterium]|nr:sigma-70 family RNA polymerase sigma factor [Elusimicrobiota bacterium]
DNIKDSLLKTPESVTEIIRTSKNVQQAIDMLPERESEIIKMRFGINNTQNLSLEEIGNKFGVSKERVRQLEFKALQRLKYVFLKLKYVDAKTADSLLLDQRGTRPDRRQNADPSFENRRKTDRRKMWN